MPSGKIQERLYPSGIRNIITNEEVSEEAQKENEYTKFIWERLSSSASISVWEPIKRLNLKVFSTPIKEKNKGKSEIITVKEHRALCAMLVNSGVDMEYVISSFEVGYPRSLMTVSGDLHPGHAGQAQLMHVSKELTIMDREKEFLHEQMIILLKEIAVVVLDANTSLQRKPRNVVVIGAMVVVQNLSPKPVWIETCEDLAKFFLNGLDIQTEGYSEVKLVFDTYEDNSLKKFLCVTKFQKKRISRT